MRRALSAPLALVAALALVVPTVVALTPSGDGDDKVSGQTYVRHDGGSDTGIAHCNNAATDPAGDPLPNTDGDSDSNDGGSRRQGNEPVSVIDPTNPNVVVAGWNDYCLTDLGAGWQAFAYSLNGGETWTNSIVPGYPQDTSDEGKASPLFGKHTDAGDPIAAFDSEGNLFVGGIAFNRANAINGDVFVATYSTTLHSSGFPFTYARTVVVGQGTPSRNFQGIFQDKPMLEVDRTGGDNNGNVYVCWSRFTGFGQNKIYFSRSTDGGTTFSRPLALTTHGFVGSVQGCDIAIEGDGDVYLTFRTFDDPSAVATTALGFVRSNDGGASFSRARKIRDITSYFPFDGSRDCGDGSEACPAGFVFARVPLEPRVTADQTGTLDGVFLVYNAIDTGSIVTSSSSYSSAGAGKVGHSVVYVVGSTNNGATWSDPVAVDLSSSDPGHQFFPDIDALDGTLAVVWQDSRSDPSYSVQLPMGNTSAAISSGTDIVNTYVATSLNGTIWASAKVSSAGHQPQYEMFANRQVPFQGDYNWISLAESSGGLVAYMTWTDNRDVVGGTDPREITPDGFDVLQCRVLVDGSYSSDRCANAGGVDQSIYGISVTIP